MQRSCESLERNQSWSKMGNLNQAEQETLLYKSKSDCVWKIPMETLTQPCYPPSYQDMWRGIKLNSMTWIIVLQGLTYLGQFPQGMTTNKLFQSRQAYLVAPSLIDCHKCTELQGPTLPLVGIPSAHSHALPPFSSAMPLCQWAHCNAHWPLLILARAVGLKLLVSAPAGIPSLPRFQSTAGQPESRGFGAGWRWQWLNCESKQSM